MRTNPRIFRSAGIVSIGTLTSRLLGLGREILMAKTFGTTAIGSAFVIAFTVPNLLRRLFGEGALSAAFIPTYIKVREEKGLNAAWGLTRNLCSLLVLLLGSITLIGVLLATVVLSMNLFSDQVRLVFLSGRILLPYMIGICLAAVMMGVLNSHRKYMVSAFTPGLLNVIWIAALAGVNLKETYSLEEKMVVISWAVLAAGVGQFLIQIPSVRSIGMKRETPITPLGPGVKNVLALMGPAALGAAVVQVNVLIDRTLAFWVADYGPTALSYSERLIYLPLGLFATALGSILLPEFSGLVHSKNNEALADTVERSLRGLMFVMLPAAVGLGVLAYPIVELIYQRGEFDSTSTLLTARALACYAPGLLLFSASKIFVPLFYAHGDTRTPVKVGMIAVLANLVCNLILIFTLPDGWKHAGLALGTVLSTLIQVILFIRITRKRFTPIKGLPIFKSFIRNLASCIPMIAVVKWIMMSWTLPHGVQLLAAIPLAALAYGVTAWGLGSPEPKEFKRH